MQLHPGNTLHQGFSSVLFLGEAVHIKTIWREYTEAGEMEDVRALCYSCDFKFFSLFFFFFCFALNERTHSQDVDAVAAL